MEFHTSSTFTQNEGYPDIFTGLQIEWHIKYRVIKAKTGRKIIIQMQKYCRDFVSPPSL